MEARAYITELMGCYKEKINKLELERSKYSEEDYIRFSYEIRCLDIQIREYRLYMDNLTKEICKLDLIKRKPIILTLSKEEFEKNIGDKKNEKQKTQSINSRNE